MPRITIKVTAKNIWHLERAIPLFGMLDSFPADSIGGPALGGAGKPGKKLHIETDQGWSFDTDIAADLKAFRNRSKARGTGKWVIQAGLKEGDSIILERVGEYDYRLFKDSFG